MIYELAWIVATIALTTILICAVRHIGKDGFGPLFGGSLVIATVVAGKLGDIGGVAISASVAIYSITFLITDVASEIYGKRFARNLVWATALLYPLIIVTAQFAIHWPPSRFYQDQEGFAAVLGTATRVTVASFLAFLASQTFDVAAFHKIKDWTNGTKLWLRNCGSTAGSQLIDTVIFYTVAFAGALPMADLIRLIVLTYALKFVILILDTPGVYIAVAYFKRRPGGSKGLPHPAASEEG